MNRFANTKSFRIITLAVSVGIVFFPVQGLAAPKVDFSRDVKVDMALNAAGLGGILPPTGGETAPLPALNGIETPAPLAPQL